ncbi:peptidoglycan L-alanyl-D-glutamate endopeptidase CwlK [Neobacillus niacini]|uniref:M15 family metallopeptidase n=1 Tax=Neobacillus niacini TaxID=86668 RepID=UPI002855F913|nr:M15 family metallopeptidase [Neobacillus niacini]MDR7079801.1 peptidoglycan L-alanyl-D-glutamate endopeptidase CwlK [Neobacillus niacini]
MLKIKFRALIPFFLLLIVLFIFINHMETNPFTGSNRKQNVSLPTELHPIVRERSDQLVQQSAAKGIVIMITDDFRSSEDQDRLYEKGRTAEGNIVTHAKGGESYHNFGLAVDFAIKTPTEEVIWDMQYDGNQNGKGDWNEVVELAKALGFEWGGDWSQFKDYPHLQMNFGLTLAELQNGERPADTSLTAGTNDVK